MPQSIQDFEVQNPIDWKRLIDELFPISVPTRAKWEKSDDIIAVLNHIGSLPNVNHLFYADGGGNDLQRAENANEEGLINLICDGMNHYFKPDSLTFESFGDDNQYQWNYFRVQMETISDTGTYPNLSSSSAIDEELLELGPNQYVNRTNWDAGEYQGEPLPDGARVVTRLLSGSLVIFQKSSFYNKLPSTYNAPHNKLDSDAFRDEIAKLRQKVIDHNPI